MQRRHLASSALLAAAGAALLPAAARADADAEQNIIFTAEDPGHWAKVASLHVPVVSVAGSTLTVTTPHPMSEPHYIVSHTVVLADGKFLERKTFKWTDKPTSAHMLPAGYTGPVTVTSTCNLHDFWVKTISV